MENWDNRFLQLASLISSWSKDPSTKVGCVIVGKNKKVVGIGYNGFPRGVADSEERLTDRDTKYLMVQHAEVNAIINSTDDLYGCVAYVTHAPCANCTGAMIQAGISEVITNPTSSGLFDRFRESFITSKIMMEEVGMKLTVIGEKNE